MNSLGRLVRVLSLLAVCGIAWKADAEAAKLNKEGEWKTTVTVKRGHAHTFWVDGLSPDTSVMSIDVEGRFTYKEDGETDEDWVYNSESTDVQDETGNTTAIYALLTPDDWDVYNVPDSIKFTVTVSGFYDEDVAANNKFSFHHSDGDADYPENYESGGSEPAVPVGSDADHAESFLPKETSTPAVASTCGTISKTLLAEYGNVYYLRTSSSLVAGRKYIFGLANSGKTTMKLTVKGGSVDLFENAKPYTNVWTDCSSAFEFIPDTSDVYSLELSGDSAYAFNFRHAVLPVRKPEQHSPVLLVANVASEEFNPGYLNNPSSGAYDDIIDDKLFKFVIPEKDDAYFFSTAEADSPLTMRLYDKNGNIKAENLSLGGGDSNVGLAWKATAKNEVVYVGVCQRLEDDEVPFAGPVTLIAEKVSLDAGTEALNVIPTAESDASPFDVSGAVPSSVCSLGKAAWCNTFTVAGRKDITYNIKARLADGGSDNGLQIVADIYQIVNNKKVFLTSGSDSIDPNSQNAALPFTPTANGTVYVEVYVADGELGVGKGLAYGPYQVCAVASGDYGVLKVDMKGAPASKMAWKILKKDGAAAKDEVFYPAGSTAILDVGDYTLAAQEVKGFSKPDATKGFGVYKVEVGGTTLVTYKYTDTTDPLDDSPDTKATEPTTKKKYAPAKLDPKAGKPAIADRTLWDNDTADWFTLAATAGSVYRFSFAEKTGAAKMAVYGPDNWTTECEYTTFKDQEEMLQVSAATKGMYYVKVSHADEGAPEDCSYTLSASVATPGVIKLAKSAISVKDTAGYADVSVSRTGKDGVVRVKFATSGGQSSAEDAYYYPTNGVLTWAEGDNKAKTVRVKIVPNSGWSTNKTVNVVFSTFSDDDETFDAANEYVPGFEADKKTGKPIDTATITIVATAKKAPGTIQVADCADAKKPVLSVAAGDTVEIPIERVLGSDGIVGVKVETVKGTANKSGEIDYTSVTTNLVWAEGEAGVKTVAVATKAVAGDYSPVKSFSLKLTALASTKGDAVQYDKPTLASSSVTVNIVNDNAGAFDDYAKTVTDAANGYTVKEGKKGQWVVLADGMFFAPNKGDLTFTFKTTGTFTYKENRTTKTFTATAKNKTLTIKNAEDFEIVGYELDGEPVTLHQGVKYETSFGDEGTVKAANLPGGLKLAQDKVTKEWIVAGVPSKAGIFQTTYTTTVGKTSNDKTVCYTVAAQGTSAGTFNGLATTFDTTNGVPTLASVTITAAVGGKLSAKVAIAGKSYSFADTGYAYVAGDPEDPDVPAYVTAELALVQKVGSGKDAATVTNWLYYTVMDVPETDTEGWRSEGEVEIQMAALPDAKGSGFQEDVWYFGKVCRDNSKSGKDGKAAWEAAMAAHAGYYTVALVAPDAMPGEPRGTGYMTMTLDAKGKAKLAGKLADGTAYSGSATAALVGEEDSPSVRVPLFAQKGTSVFGGWLSIKAREDGVPVAEIDSPDTDLVWKNDDPASTRDGEEGFALYLCPVGGWYDTVSNLQRSYLESDLFVDIPEEEDALDEIMDALALTGDYAFVAQPSGQAVDLLGNNLSVEKQVLAKDAAKKLNDWAASVNASNVKLAFKRATGIVSGTFDLWYEGTNAKGTFEQKSVSGLKHEGILLLSRGDDGYLEDDVLTAGFFLAPQTLGKRKWNGSYRFDIKAVDVARDWKDADPE